MEAIDIELIMESPRNPRRLNMQPRDATPASQNNTSELATFLRNDGGPPGSNPGARVQCGPFSEARPPSSIAESKHGFGMSISETIERSGSLRSSASMSNEKLKNGPETSTATFEDDGLLYKSGVLVKQPAPTTVSLSSTWA